MSQQKVMIFGTFDIFHEGHKDFIKQAKKYGDELFIIVARDKTVQDVKGSLPRNNEQQRLKEIKKYFPKNKITLGSLSNKYQIIQKLKPDVICLGYDQKSFTEDLRKRLNELELINTKIIRLKSYQPEIYKSSKFLKRQV